MQVGNPHTNHQTLSASALAQHHSLGTLTLIETYTSKVKKTLDAWNLRITLTATPAHRIPHVAATRLKELRAKRTAKPGVRITYRAKGPNTLSITDDATTIANMRAVLESTNTTDLLQAANDIFFKEGTGSTPAVRTQVIITLNELDQIINGDGDEIELNLTNGARMTGAEFLTHKFAEIGYATIVHPIEGPINTWRLSRGANLNPSNNTTHKPQQGTRGFRGSLTTVNVPQHAAGCTGTLKLLKNETRQPEDG